MATQLWQSHLLSQRDPRQDNNLSNLIKGFHPDLEYPQRTILPFFDILTIAQHCALREDIGGERSSPYLIAWLVRKPVVASKAALNLGASYKLTEVLILNRK